jgi:hypothetical protein
MALFIEGKSECPICGKPINKKEKRISFPAFVANAKDPLYIFNDETCHQVCVENHKLGHKAVEMADRFLKIFSPENRKCTIGGNAILSYDNFIGSSLLTSDETEELFEFNFMLFDKNNVSKWNKLNSFLEAASKFKNENKWGDLPGYNYLDILVDSIKKASN